MNRASSMIVTVVASLVFCSSTFTLDASDAAAAEKKLARTVFWKIVAQQEGESAPIFTDEDLEVGFIFLPDQKPEKSCFFMRMGTVVDGSWKFYTPRDGTEKTVAISIALSSDPDEPLQFVVEFDAKDESLMSMNTSVMGSGARSFTRKYLFEARDKVENREIPQAIEEAKKSLQ